MERVGERIKAVMNSWQEKWGGKIILLADKLKRGLQESSQVRAMTAVVVTACGLGGFFWLQDDVGETTAVANILEPAAVVQTHAKKVDRLEVAGAEQAVDKSPLRNPFLPNHPTREESLQNRKNSANNPVPGGNVKGAGGAAASGTSQGQISGMPISVPVKQTVEKEQKQIYLQGIIDTDGRPGALLTLEGQSRFLLAGESWQGYVVESVSGEQAAVNGHIINIGDTVAM